MSTQTPTSTPVLEFYSGAKILITGGTGFLGKSLLEKLIRVCTNIDHIYVLIRQKKDKDPNARLKETFNDAIFNTLKSIQPDFEKKVTCVPGNVISPNLGINSELYDTLTKEITHVIHSAATVRFKETLKSALEINVLGLREIIFLCNKCIKLKVFVYLSTAFCYRHDVNFKEDFIDPPMPLENCVYLMKALSEEQMNAITPYVTKPWPNNYSFTKAIAESVIKDHAKNYPVVVLRPSIVMGSYSEPVPGWIDNINGPTGVLAAAGSGVLRLLWVNENAKANLVPVDMVTNALICSAWEVGSTLANQDSDTNDKKSISGTANSTEPCAKKNCKIYNFVSKEDHSLTWGEFLKINFKHGIKYPTNFFIWYYTISLIKIKFLFNVLTIFYHFIPAIILDVGFLLIGRKPQFVKVYKKIYGFTEALAYFALNEWHFEDKNTQSLWEKLSEEDKKLFFFNMAEVDWDNYFKNIVKGIRIFIFKLDDSTLNQARRKLLMFWVAHRLLQISIAGIITWLIYKVIFFKIFSPTLFIESMLVTPKMTANSS